MSCPQSLDVMLCVRWVYISVRRAGVAVSAYPLSAYRGVAYVQTSFSLSGGTFTLVSTYPPPPVGTLKLEKDHFHVTSPSFRLPPGVR